MAEAAETEDRAHARDCLTQSLNLAPSNPPSYCAFEKALWSPSTTLADAARVLGLAREPAAKPVVRLQIADLPSLVIAFSNTLTRRTATVGSG